MGRLGISANYEVGNNFLPSYILLRSICFDESVKSFSCFLVFRVFLCAR